MMTLGQVRPLRTVFFFSVLCLLLSFNNSLPSVKAMDQRERGNWNTGNPFGGNWDNLDQGWEKGWDNKDNSWDLGWNSGWNRPSRPSRPTPNNPLAALLAEQEFRGYALRLAGKRVKNVCEVPGGSNDSNFVAIPKIFFPRAGRRDRGNPLCNPNACLWISSRQSDWGNMILKVKWALDTASWNVALTDDNLQKLGGDGVMVRYRVGPCRLYR